MPKRVRPKAGMVVALPLLDGSFGLGHVAWYDYEAIVALYTARAEAPDALADAFDDEPIAILRVTGDELRAGEWPVIGAREPKYEVQTKSSFTATTARMLLNAWHGLLAWDHFADTTWYTRLLLPGVDVPPTARFEKDAPPADAKPRKRVRPAVGQVFVVPLRDGTFGLGHVALADISITIALYAARAATPEVLSQRIDAALAAGAISTMEITSNELRSGEWPVIGSREPAYAPDLLDKKGVSHTSPVARFFLSAWHGSEPWDGLADPKAYEELLLDGVSVPRTAVYARGKPPPRPKPPPVTHGPAELHVQILFPGDGMPDVVLLRRRQAFEERVEAVAAGEVTDAEAGGGVMSVWITTDDVRRALPLVEAELAAAGFAEDAVVDVEPLSDGP